MSSSGIPTAESGANDDISGVDGEQNRFCDFDAKSRDVCDSAHATKDRLPRYILPLRLLPDVVS